VDWWYKYNTACAHRCSLTAMWLVSYTRAVWHHSAFQVTMNTLSHVQYRGRVEIQWHYSHQKKIFTVMRLKKITKTWSSKIISTMCWVHKCKTWHLICKGKHVCQYQDLIISLQIWDNSLMRKLCSSLKNRITVHEIKMLMSNHVTDRQTRLKDCNVVRLLPFKMS
jgi:hypothetical protein